MNKENKSPENNVVNNILQFPVRKKDAELPPPTAPKDDKKSSKETLAATVLAVALLTMAVNRNTFETSRIDSANLSSQTVGGRAIASVQSVSRNAAWEKELSEKLASAQIREVASAGIGRPATLEEKLRWGVLEEKYTIKFSEQEHKIDSILLQDPVSKPAYILDRSGFLSEYGYLFETTFAAAKLKSVEKLDDKIVEAYTLFDKDNRRAAKLALKWINIRD